MHSPRLWRHRLAVDGGAWQLKVSPSRPPRFRRGAFPGRILRALAAAGAISLEDAARLLRTRGEAMQAAVPAGEGAMAAVLGLDLATQSAEVAAEVAAQADDRRGRQ